MIYINVTGTRNKKKAALARDAAIFAFEHLMPRMKKQVDLEIVFAKLDGICADQVETGDREFEIEVDNKLQGDELLTAIFHEVVHCVQDLRGGKSDWDKPYYERPHEIEAYEKQEIILEKWQKGVDILANPATLYK
jgi:hypothetical protein